MTEESDIKVIFAEALEREDLEERAAYLDQACGANISLRKKAEILLNAYNQAGNDFLEGSPVDGNVTLDDSSLVEGSGTTIGPYKLLERIGEGGMAVVYMAEQTVPIRRKVALKIIKLGMDTKSVIARFEAERQALAMMDHPNIAKVLDAGATETGRPYFVMELVTGVSITEYCDKNNLSTKERLGLFIQVCNAVQHAHQKGIIHRDIKPTNVMVSQHEGRPVPKVIDFGIAKATNQRLTEKTLFTRYAHIIGTPAYMSPEQADLGDMDIDTRSDIYSLGVLLYELLTGTTPFSEKGLREAGYLEMQRIIREQEPTKPSTKLSTLGDTLIDVAKHRSATPDFLRKAIRGDLDWIIMKALEKDRTRRYSTATDLRADITRHLSNEPVEAASPKFSYNVQKFVRRNRALVAGVMTVTLVLIIGIVGVAMFALKAQQARYEATAVANFLEQDIFGTLDPRRDSGRRVSVQELLDVASQRVEAKFQDQPIVEASVHKILGFTFHGLGKLDKAEHHLKRSLKIYRDLLGEKDALTIEVLRELGYLYFFRRERHKAEDILKKSLRYSRDVLGNRHPATLRNMHMLGAVLENLGQDQEAESLLYEALEGCEQVLGPNHEDTMICLGCLGILHKDKGQLDIAERFLKDMLYKRQPAPDSILAEGSPDRFHFLVYLAWVYNDQASYPEARELAEMVMEDASTVLGQAHYETIFAMVILSIIYESEGQYEDAEMLLLKAIEIRNREAFIRPDWRWPEYQLGHFYLNRKRYQEAHDTFMKGIQKYSRFQGKFHGQVCWVIRYCVNLWEKHERPEWTECYRALLPVREKQQ
jgi:serine/threonine protein kinase/tetratricopeptide (TPR) repeat protein